MTILRYNQNLDNDALFLLELPEQLNLDEIKIKSTTEDQPAVLVTDSKTYSLRNVLSSNALLITEEQRNEDSNIEDNSENKKITLDVLCERLWYIECVPCLPKTDLISKLVLLFNEKTILNQQSGAVDSLRTFSYIETNLCASRKEIQDALSDMNAFELEDGQWYILDINFAKYQLDLLLASLMAEGKEINEASLTVEEVFKLLNEEAQSDRPASNPDANDMDIEEDMLFIPFNVIEALVKTFSIQNSDSNSYTLCSIKIGKFMAEYLFKTKQHVWPLNNFLTEWSLLVPSSVQIDVSMLHGIALIEDDSSKDLNIIRYFPKSLVLAMANGDVRQRFDLLFAMNRKWTHDALYPYISDLAHTADSKKEGLQNTQTISLKSSLLDAVLLKYARVAKNSGSVWYTSRFPISTKMLALLDSVENKPIE